MKYLIIGAGAIGTYLGVSLLKAGNDVYFYDRGPIKERIQNNGMSLISNGIESHYEQIDIVDNLETVLPRQQIDVGLIAIKAFDTDQLIDSFIQYKLILPPLICFQNGVENEEKYGIVFGSANIISGSITSAVGRQPDGKIVIKKSRGIAIGNTHQIVAKVVDNFNEAGLNTKSIEDSHSMKWSKMITNLLGNASAAILNMMPLQVYSNKGLYRLECLQILETIEVMRAMNLKVIDLPGTPIRALTIALTKFPAWVSQPIIKNVLGIGRGDKEPSLLQDLNSGRKNSEIDYLNGAVVRAGAKVNIATSINNFYWKTLKEILEEKIRRKDFDHNPQALINYYQSIIS